MQTSRPSLPNTAPETPTQTVQRTAAAVAMRVRRDAGDDSTRASASADGYTAISRNRGPQYQPPYHAHHPPYATRSPPRKIVHASRISAAVGVAVRRAYPTNASPGAKNKTPLPNEKSNDSIPSSSG